MREEDFIARLVGHKNVMFVSSGDATIFLALVVAKQKGKTTLIVPDQGGWLSYKSFPKLLDLKITEVSTDCGVIQLADLERKADNGSVLIFPSLGGYAAEQPLDNIYRICNSAGCLVVLDASPTIGNKQLCNGEFADIVVGSFGKWKSADHGYGGFITFKEKAVVDNRFLRILRFDEERRAGLMEKLDQSAERFETLVGACEHVKKELAEFDIIHRNSGGLVVLVRFKDDAEKENIIGYCKKHKYEYTLCPRYIRVLDQAICIEVKRR
ncbi:MAG: DegT/DnrJ/EryC1/StrS family aminotransferase [Candidatus Woesearchaeota archaeon]